MRDLVQLRPRLLARSSHEDVLDDARRLAPHRQHLKAYLRNGGQIDNPLQLLNAQEQIRYEAYLARWEALPPNSRCCLDDLVCHLGDNPLGGWLTWSAKGCKVPTMRRSSGLLAIPKFARLLTLREQYAAMGYPVFDDLAAAAQVKVFSMWTRGLTHPNMKRALGNSMAVASVGVFAAVVLACTRYKQSFWEPY